MPKNHPKPPNSGYGYKLRDLTLLDWTWTRFWQKGRVKRRQNSLHVYPVLRDGNLAIIDFFTIAAEVRAVDKTRNIEHPGKSDNYEKNM